MRRGRMRVLPDDRCHRARDSFRRRWKRARNTPMNRLRRQYADRALIPTKAEEEGVTLSLQLLQRLYRHVMSEGYGE